MKRYTVSLFVLVALVLGLFFEPTAQAISPGQRDIDLTFVPTTSSSYVIVPGSVVTVPAAGSGNRECILQFSTEVGGSLGDRTDLAYAIDSTSPSSCFARGAEFFHLGNGGNSSDIRFLETKTHIGVVTLNSSAHTIRPCFRAINLNAAGALSFFDHRTLTVECTTN
jgi:hypothetical protein